MTRPTILAAAALACAGGAAAQGRPSVALLDTALLAAPRLTESSGVAPSRRQPGVYWSLNDSGDDAVLYATDSTGRDLGFVRVAGARNVDWEDLAIGPCVVSAETCLYVADIGDNRASRPYVVIYRVPEPEPPASPADTLRTAPVLDSIVLSYPDHPRDAEALAVDRGGALLLVTKELFGQAPLFRTRAGEGGAVVLERSLALPVSVDLVRGRLVTGAALSPDGDVLVVRTYVSLHLFKRGSEAFDVPLTPPEGIPIPVVEAQGEAVAFDGPARLVLTSERGFGSHAVLTRLRVHGLQP